MRFSAFGNVLSLCVRGAVSDDDRRQIYEHFGSTRRAVIKPALHDECDAFRGRYPQKLRVAAGADAILRELTGLHNLFPRYSFLVQELVVGQPISWCGYVVDRRPTGYEVRAIVKVPLGEAGGTTVLAQRAPARASLQKAVEELCEALHLEGLFEIEFVQTSRGLVFIGDLNPRPCLQASLGLGREDIYTSYLLANGFTPRRRAAPAFGEDPKLWGSAHRYLNGIDRLSWIDVRHTLRILAADPCLQKWIPVRARLKYLLDLALVVGGRAVAALVGALARLGGLAV
jgi:hypothetical protein